MSRTIVNVSSATVLLKGEYNDIESLKPLLDYSPEGNVTVIILPERYSHVNVHVCKKHVRIGRLTYKFINQENKFTSYVYPETHTLLVPGVDVARMRDTNNGEADFIFNYGTNQVPPTDLEMLCEDVRVKNCFEQHSGDVYPLFNGSCDVYDVRKDNGFDYYFVDPTTDEPKPRVVNDVKLQGVVGTVSGVYTYSNNVPVFLVDNNKVAVPDVDKVTTHFKIEHRSDPFYKHILRVKSTCYGFYIRGIFVDCEERIFINTYCGRLLVVDNFDEIRSGSGNHKVIFEGVLDHNDLVYPNGRY